MPKTTVLRAALFGTLLFTGTGCGPAEPMSEGAYLFLWAGDSAGTSSDFLAVIDAAPASPQYGAIIASIPTGESGAHPHHTEDMVADNGHLLANGFRAGRTWLFDLSTPREPKILTSFGDLAGFSHPHTYMRMENGNVLATFQYRADPAAAPPTHAHDAMPAAGTHTTGGLVEMDERGTVIRSASATDSTIADRNIFPYSALPIPGMDRIVSTTTDMDAGNKAATSEWLQFWRLSDLKLLRSIALPTGARGNEHLFTGEPRPLPDGKGVYIHTFSCGLYLIPDVSVERPTATLVASFEAKECGVPILTGNYWIQPVSDAHVLVALDITDPEHPRQVSSLSLGEDELPHWLAIDRTGTRLVVNSSGGGTGNRLFIVDLDRTTGALTLDDRFRDVGASRPGVRLSGKVWPHGYTGTPIPHGTVFSR